MADSLADIRRAFDSWRQQRRGRNGVYPEWLRARALALPWKGKDAELSAALGLSHVEVLRKWRSAAERRGIQVASKSRGSAQFVEVATVAELSPSAGTGDGRRSLELVLESNDGRCLRIRGEVDAATLVVLAQVALGSGSGGGVERCCK